MSSAGRLSSVAEWRWLCNSPSAIDLSRRIEPAQVQCRVSNEEFTGRWEVLSTHFVLCDLEGRMLVGVPLASVVDIRIARQLEFETRSFAAIPSRGTILTVSTASNTLIVNLPGENGAQLAALSRIAWKYATGDLKICCKGWKLSQHLGSSAYDDSDAIYTLSLLPFRIPCVLTKYSENGFDASENAPVVLQFGEDFSVSIMRSKERENDNGGGGLALWMVDVENVVLDGSSSVELKIRGGDAYTFSSITRYSVITEKILFVFLLVRTYQSWEAAQKILLEKTHIGTDANATTIRNYALDAYKPLTFEEALCLHTCYCGGASETTDQIPVLTYPSPTSRESAPTDTTTTDSDSLSDSGRAIVSSPMPLFHNPSPRPQKANSVNLDIAIADSGAASLLTASASVTNLWLDEALRQLVNHGTFLHQTVYGLLGHSAATEKALDFCDYFTGCRILHRPTWIEQVYLVFQNCGGGSDGRASMDDVEAYLKQLSTLLTDAPKAWRDEIEELLGKPEDVLSVLGTLESKATTRRQKGSKGNFQGSAPANNGHEATSSSDWSTRWVTFRQLATSIRASRIYLSNRSTRRGSVTGKGELTSPTSNASSTTGNPVNPNEMMTFSLCIGCPQWRQIIRILLGIEIASKAAAEQSAKTGKRLFSLSGNSSENATTGGRSMSLFSSTGSIPSFAGKDGATVNGAQKPANSSASSIFLTKAKYDLTKLMDDARYVSGTAPAVKPMSTAVTLLSRRFRAAKHVHFTEYAASVFGALREYFNESTATYIYSLGISAVYKRLLLGKLRTLEVVHSSGSSGAFFYRSCDNRYFLKTIRPAEMSVVRLTLPQYVEYVKKSPNTLLTQYCGLYALRVERTKVSFLVMSNVFAGSKTIHWTYDLKGSTLNRSTTPQQARNGAALKDNDLKKRRFTLQPSIRSALLSQLEEDSTFLSTINVLDYSLIIGVHECSPAEESSTPPITSPVSPPSGPRNRVSIDRPRSFFANGITSADGKEVYYVGLIDLATGYTLKKRGEHYGKSIIHNARTISCVPPPIYQERFMIFMRNIFIEPTDPVGNAK